MIDGTKISVTGEITDKIYYKGGKTEIRKGHNLVVRAFSNLVMSLLAGKSGFSGITYWAVGSGATSWDNTPVSPSLGETTLTSELGRKSISASNFKFIDKDGKESSSPTNILKITVTFGTNECNGTWREFGLFGGNATTNKNTGIMVDKRHHEVIVKNESMSVERTLVLTLNLA